MGVLDISALGDSLGAPYEFNEYIFDGADRLVFKQYHEHYGEWTDDTYMALCIALGIIKNKKIDGGIYQNISELFLRWRNEYPRGIGIQTERILSKFQSGQSYSDLMELSRINHINNPNSSAGNGSLMRIHPISLLNISGEKRAIVADTITKLTHYDQLCCEASIIWVELLANARLTGELKVNDSLKYVHGESKKYWTSIIDEALHNDSKIFSNRGWWVVPSLQQALSAVANNMDVLYSDPLKIFEEIIEAKDSDSDTICAISGGLMGALGVKITDFSNDLNIDKALNGKWPERMGVKDLYHIESILLNII